MKKNIYFLLLSLLFLFQLPVFGGQSPAAPINVEDHPVMQAPVTLNRAEIESQLGRKLTFKELIGVSLLKSRIAKEQKHHSVPGAAAGKTNWLAIAGFVIGLVSLFIAGIPLGIVAVVFSSIAMGQIKKNGEKGSGFAVAGLILGIVGIVGAAIVIANM